MTATRTFSLLPYLQMARPANVVTAWADILVGYAVAGLALSATSEVLVNHSFAAAADYWPALGWLLLATTGLYAGGVVFNDVFDAELDAQERPERPIPSGRVSQTQGAIVGALLLMAGIAAAAQVGVTSLGLAVTIALSCLLYDSFSKHNTWLGPINMGLCRGMNWMLGASAVPLAVSERWYLAIVPILFIAAITAISQGEVKGGNTTTGWIAIGLMLVVLASPLLLSGLSSSFTLVSALPFAIVLGWRILPPFLRATREPKPDFIRAAVRAGILSLVVLDAAISSGFAGVAYGLVVLCLLPISMVLARLFAVT